MISKQTETKSNEINYILIAVLKKKLIKNKSTCRTLPALLIVDASPDLPNGTNICLKRFFQDVIRNSRCKDRGWN